MSENLTKSLFENDYAPSKRYAFDLSLAENPYGCSEIVRNSLTDNLTSLNNYPDKNNLQLKNKICSLYKIDVTNLYIGTGVTGIIQDFCKVFVKPGQHVLMPESSFPGPIFGATIMGGGAILVPFEKNFRFDFQSFIERVNEQTAFVYFCNPNNPTGILEDSQKILDVARKVKCPVVVSEANIEYAGTLGLLKDINNLPSNLVVLRSFSKIYGLASLRIGYGVSSKDIISRLEVSINPFRISNLAEIAASHALDDQDFVIKSMNSINNEKDFLFEKLSNMGFICTPSQGNTFIAKIPEQEIDALELNKKLNLHNCAIVPCNTFIGIGNRYIRIAPRTREINTKFLEVLNSLY